MDIEERRAFPRTRLVLEVDLFDEAHSLGRFHTRDIAPCGMFVEAARLRLRAAGARLQAVVLLDHVAANWLVMGVRISRVARDGLGIAFVNEDAKTVGNVVYRLSGEGAAYAMGSSPAHAGGLRVAWPDGGAQGGAQGEDATHARRFPRDRRQ